MSWCGRGTTKTEGGHVPWQYPFLVVASVVRFATSVQLNPLFLAFAIAVIASERQAADLVRRFSFRAMLSESPVK